MDQEYTDMEINTNIVDSTQETYILGTSQKIFDMKQMSASEKIPTRQQNTPTCHTYDILEDYIYQDQKMSDLKQIPGIQKIPVSKQVLDKYQ